jgi:hypothetical protein
MVEGVRGVIAPGWGKGGLVYHVQCKLLCQMINNASLQLLACSTAVKMPARTACAPSTGPQSALDRTAARKHQRT